MSRYYHAIRRPVRRPGADDYLLLTLLSFALSVSLTRLFLELTGYPQLGGGTLHIAHLLWGGLLLFVAALLPLIFANRWVYRLVAVLAGVGVGLFMDEVGKFITQTNDYFYPPAAPIIYAFFLFCVLVYTQVRRPASRQPRAELYVALEAMEEVLDHDLDSVEKAETEARLRYVASQKESQPELARLAEELLDYLQSEKIYLAPPPPRRLKQIQERLLAFEGRHFNRARFRLVLVVILGLMGAAALVHSTGSFISNIQPGPQAGTLVFQVSAVGGEASYTYVYWYLLLLFTEGLGGALLVAAAGLLLIGREQPGLSLVFFTLLVNLTMVNMFWFYYYQFSTILVAAVQFVILLGVLYYRQRYLLIPTPSPGAE